MSSSLSLSRERERPRIIRGGDGGTLGGSLLTPFLCPVSHFSSSSPPWSSLCVLVPCCTLSLVPSLSLSPQVSRIPLSLSLSFSLILYAGLNGIVMRRRLQFPPSTLLAIASLSPPSPPTPLRILLLVLPEFVFLCLCPLRPPLLLARSQPSFSISARAMIEPRRERGRREYRLDVYVRARECGDCGGGHCEARTRARARTQRSVTFP